MAANPRLVAYDTDVSWDGGTFHVPGGTIVDIPAGSSLEAAYGDALVDLGTADAASISNGGYIDALGGWTGP